MYLKLTRHDHLRYLWKRVSVFFGGCLGVIFYENYVVQRHYGDELKQLIQYLGFIVFFEKLILKKCLSPRHQTYFY